MLTPKRSTQLLMFISILLLSKVTLAVDSEALGEELKKGQHRAETQKPAPKQTTSDKVACLQQSKKR